jgi:hypothetical protein
LELVLRLSDRFQQANNLDCRRTTTTESISFARANEKLTAFLELESVIHRPPPISDRRKLDNFLFEIGLSFAIRDE